MENEGKSHAKTGCCPFSHNRRRNRVSPQPETCNLTEIRPNRFINILLFGPGFGSIAQTESAVPERELITRTGLMENVGIFPDGQTALFFIHGVGGSSTVWKHQYEYFTNIGFDVIVPDLLGHGLSAAPRKASKYHFSEIALDLLSIFDRFHKRKNVLIGHSYGSSFATLLAKERELLVTKLILVSGGGPTPLGPQSGVFQLPVCVMSCFKSCIVSGLLKKAFYKNHDANVRDSAFRLHTYVLRHIMRGQDWLEGDEEFHESMLIPTLLIYGQNDELVSLEEELTMKQYMNGSQLDVIKDSSHMVMMERPDLVNKHIQQFLAVKQWRFVPSAIGNECHMSENGLRLRPSPFDIG